MRPQHILERFEIDQKTAGAKDFLALTYRVAVGERTSEVVQDLARQGGKLVCQRLRFMRA